MQSVNAAAAVNRGALLVMLIAITAVGPLALNLFVPSMPGMQHVFDADYATVQLTLTLYLAAMACAQLLFGTLSDRFGRRRVLLAGLAIFVAGSALAATAQSIEQLIVARVVQAVGGSTGMVLGRAIIRDLYDQEAAASMIAYVTMAMVLAPMIAPTLGGFIDATFGWQSGFVLVGAAGVLVAAAIWQRLPETNRRPAATLALAEMLYSYRRLLASPRYFGYALTMAFTSMIFFSFLAGAPYIMTELLGYTPVDYGLYFVLVSGGYMIGNFLAGRVSPRVGALPMVVVGCTLALANMALLAALAGSGVLTPLALFGPMAGAAVGNGLLLPNATAIALGVRPDIAGAASGLAGFLQIAMGALGTWLVGLWQDDTQWPMVLVMCAAGAFSALLFVYAEYFTGRRVAQTAADRTLPPG